MKAQPNKSTSNKIKPKAYKCDIPRQGENQWNTLAMETELVRHGYNK